MVTFTTGTKRGSPVSLHYSRCQLSSLLSDRGSSVLDQVDPTLMRAVLAKAFNTRGLPLDWLFHV